MTDPIHSEELCYTESMQGKRTFWPTWARFLHRWGIDEVASVLLRSLGPLNLLLAQFLHAGHPFLSPGRSAEQWQAISALLEDPKESQSFAAFLLEELDH